MSAINQNILVIKYAVLCLFIVFIYCSHKSGQKYNKMWRYAVDLIKSVKYSKTINITKEEAEKQIMQARKNVISARIKFFSYLTGLGFCLIIYGFLAFPHVNLQIYT